MAVVCICKPEPLIAATGGKLVSYLVKLGQTDFYMVLESDHADMEGMVAALVGAGAGGGVPNLKTQQAFTSAELLAAQKRVTGMAASFSAPNC